MTGYVKNATNTININGLEITRDENGVLRIGDVIIPQRKLLWSGELSCDENQENVTLSLADKDINAGDTLEILFYDCYPFKMHLTNDWVTALHVNGFSDVLVSDGGSYFNISTILVLFDRRTKELKIEPRNIYSSDGRFLKYVSTINKVYKVIE